MIMKKQTLHLLCSFLEDSSCTDEEVQSFGSCGWCCL